MKVLKNGHDVQSWRLIVVCHSCMSELELDANDISYYGNESYQIDHRYYPAVEEYTCKCPICMNLIVVQDIPPAVKRKAKQDDRH